MAGTLESLRHTKTILLTTYRRDGTPIGTPVSIAFDGERAFFRSYDKAWKTRRLRNNPRVEAAPCTCAASQQASRSQHRRGCLAAMKRKRRPRRWRGATRYCKGYSCLSATG